MLDFVPLAAQVVYTSAWMPGIIALYRAKRSDQHSIVKYAATGATHLLMAAWCLWWAREPSLAAAYAIAFVTTLPFISLTAWYRRNPK